MGRSALAERPIGGDPSSVDDAAVLALLTEADSAPSLPRLGGMARPDGVAIVSERVWCFSRTGGEPLSTGPMPRPPALLVRLPLARGLAKLAVSLAPLLGRRGTVRTGERLVLLGGLLLQRLTTREPDLLDTRVALRAVAGVLVHDFRASHGAAGIAP